MGMAGLKNPIGDPHLYLPLLTKEKYLGKVTIAVADFAIWFKRIRILTLKISSRG